MKKLLCFIPSFASSAIMLAGEPTMLGRSATLSAEQLSAGGIVISETLASGIVTSTAGKLEPGEVPTEMRIFEIGSISKVFTGLLLAQAVVERKLTLETPIKDLLQPGFKFADPRVGAITVKELATHTSGLPRLPDNMEDSTNPLDP
jgi:serine-type D-Ala-D-Ala carboxypeptidase/endopeptidase